MATKRVREAEESKRRKKVRQHLRSLIRSVMFNRIWLMDSDEQKLSLNVKKNIAMLVRTQRKIGMLTIAEKALIRSHHHLRTVEDRMKLVTLVSGLTCFAKLPPKVRARLVPCIKFLFCQAGRTIIKEGGIAVTCYFILSGEVERTKKQYDYVKKEYVEKVEFVSGPGDCIGDIELVEDCLRNHTYTATTEVELLVVLEDDFNRILRKEMTEQWMDKKRAITSLGYFNFFNNAQMLNACKLGILRQFEALETIYSEDKGPLSYVYFIISGECIVLQWLKMQVTKKRTTKTYELVDISKTDADDQSLLEDLTNTEMLKKLKEVNSSKSEFAFNIDKEIASDDEDLTDEKLQRQISLRRSQSKNVEFICALQKDAAGSAQLDKSMHSYRKSLEPLPEIRAPSREITEEKKYSTNIEIEESDEVPFDTIYSGTKLSADRKNSIRSIDKKNSTRSIDKKNSAASIASKKKSVNIDQNSQYTLTSMIRTAIPTKKIENHFTDIGSMTHGAIFGIGEACQHRVVMARTTVQCFMLPRFWLFEKAQNPGNIWQRKRFAIDTTIPSREVLFKNFLMTRKWLKFKKEYIESLLDPNSNTNPTKIEDVPIICRIIEAED